MAIKSVLRLRVFSTSIGYLLLKGVSTGEIRRVLTAFMILAAFLSITVSTTTYLTSTEINQDFTAYSVQSSQNTHINHIQFGGG
jgi:hypothetical protein